MSLSILTKDGIQKVLEEYKTLHNEISIYVNEDEYDTLTPDARAYVNAVMTHVDDMVLVLTQLEDLIKNKQHFEENTND